MPRRIDEKLGEVPFDFFGAQQARCVFFEFFKKRVGFGAVDVHFFVERKLHAKIPLAKAGDLGAGPGSCLPN